MAILEDPVAIDESATSANGTDGAACTHLIDRHGERGAAHHTAEQRHRIAELVVAPIPHQEEAFRWIESDAAAIDAFRRLMLRFDRYVNVLQAKRLCRGGNYRSAIFGLAALSHHHASWLRSPESWHSSPTIAGKPQRIDQFADLARHLLAKYPVPSFMDAAWFKPYGPPALQAQKWFMLLATGSSVHDLDLPVALTHRMSHLLMQGRNRDSIERNLRFAQTIGMGGDRPLAKAILRTRLGRQIQHDEFWRTVVLFLVNNSMMDPGAVGPIVDYIHNMKYAPSRVVQQDGVAVQGPPPRPDFSMKGRSATKLLRQVDAWHGHLSRENSVDFQSWNPCGLRPCETVEETPELGHVRWTVQELLSSWALAAEGRVMHHCVVSYSDQCADGRSSIWSISMQAQGEEEPVNVLTVAVDLETQSVTQARGRYNAAPNKPARNAKLQGEEESGYLRMLNRSSIILQAWAEREHLRRDD